MFRRVADVGPYESADASVREGLRQLQAAAGSNETIPVQAVLVHAVRRVDVSTEVKWADGAEDHALLSEHAHRKVLFQRTGSARINPHAALARWCRTRDPGSVVLAGDDLWRHDFLSASHRCA